MDEASRFLILSLDGGNFAVPIISVLEITTPRGIEKDEALSGPYEGTFEFRGEKIPVLNLKKLFQLKGAPGNTLLVVKGAKGVAGFLADSVTEIIDSGQKPAPVPTGIMDRSLRYYTGVVRSKGELILLLNEDGLLQ